MITQASIAIALFINAGAILGLFWKLSRFISRIEFQHELMWSDYAVGHGLAPRDRRANDRRAKREE